MQRTHISTGSKFEEQAAYSRAVVCGDDVFVSGTTGYNYDTMTIEDDVVAQCEQTFRNLRSALEQAGSGLQDVVRVTYILPNPSDFESCWPILRKYLGDVRPAATMFAAPLVNDSIKIEIEVTARIGR